MRRKTPRVGLKWVCRYFLSIFIIRPAYPLPRLSVHHLLRDSKTVNEKKFLSTPKIQKKTWTVLLWRNTKQTWTLLKLKNTKNWIWQNTNQTDMSITKIEKYKILNITENKTDMNITKVDKYKRNWTTLLRRNAKLTWTWMKNWAALLRRNTKQITTTLWWIMQ